MKKKLCAILSLSILCFIGCSSVENITFEELMEEVNAKHQEVEAMDVDISDYIGDLVDDEQRNQYYLKQTQEKYDPDCTVGTFISNLIPLAAVLQVAWILFMLVWVALDIPLGPGVSVHLPAGIL